MTQTLKETQKTPRKYCVDCKDAQQFSTGSTIFWICKKTGRYKSGYDQCDLQKQQPKPTIKEMR